MSVFFLKTLLTVLIIVAIIIAYCIYVETQKEINNRKIYANELQFKIKNELTKNSVLRGKIQLLDDFQFSWNNHFFKIYNEIVSLQEEILKLVKL